MIKSFKEEIFEIENEKGEKIHAVYNYVDKNQPLIIIPPQFEKTIRTNMTCMLYLINNGFNVFRYDNRYSNGNSTGEIENYSLLYVIEDLVDVIKFIKTSSDIETNNGLGLLGISISSRAIFRYLSMYSNEIDVFVSLVGVVDMQYTIKQILGEDVVQQYLDNPNNNFGIRKVLKYPINYNHFLSHLTKNNLHTLESTRKDIENISTPIYLIVSEQDQWINMEDYNEAFKNNTEILQGAYMLPGAGHELYKNPQSAEYALEKIVLLFREFFQMDNSNFHIIKPQINEIILHNRHERKREMQYN